MQQQHRYMRLKLMSWILNPSKDNENRVVSFSSDSLESSIEYPENGLTYEYGMRNNTLQLAASRARAGRDNFIPVQIDIGGVRPAAAKHWFGSWEGKSVFDMTRLSQQCEPTIQRLFRQYMKDDGYSQSDVHAMGCWRKLGYIKRFPRYLDRLIGEPFLGHVQVVIWGTYEHGRYVRRATVFDTRCIERVTAVAAENYPVTI